MGTHLNQSLEWLSFSHLLTVLGKRCDVVHQFELVLVGCEII